MVAPMMISSSVPGTPWPGHKGGFGGEGGEKDGTGDGRFRVGVGQPRVEYRPGAVDADTDENQP